MGDGPGGGCFKEIMAERYKKGQRGKCGEEKKRLEGRVRREKRTKRKRRRERVLVNKPQASCPTSDEWGRGGSPAGGDTPNSRVGAQVAVLICCPRSLEDFSKWFFFFFFGVGWRMKRVCPFYCRIQ